MYSFKQYFNTSYLPGSLISIDDQCALLYGPGSNYNKCSVSFPTFLKYQLVVFFYRLLMILSVTHSTALSLVVLLTIAVLRYQP